MDKAKEYKIWFDSITMQFPGVLALDDVSLGVKPGTVHVLMGENGAGKSTLMKILNGSYQPSGGNIFIDGEKVAFRSIEDAAKHNISMIYQELNYIPDMTVEKFIMLCHEPQKMGFINWKEVNRTAKQILEEEKIDIDPKQTLRNLSVSEVQLLEIIREIRSNDVKILIMDEPTSALTEKEVEGLFTRIEALKKQGITILYISHKMDEIFRIADEISVMRDGKMIHTAPASEFTQDSIVKMMVGREISNVYPKEQVDKGEVLLEVRNLNSEYLHLKNINLNVRAGEIVGIGGLMGAGRTEVVRALYGLDPFDSGEIKVAGREVKIRNVSDAISSGIAMASEDRKRYGLVLCRNILENVSLSSQRRISKGGFLNLKKEKKIVEDYFGQLKVKAPNMYFAAMNLSGGNQQKVVLAKCLMTQAKVLILDEPTRGIDIGAKYEIYKLMIELAKAGIGIIFISSELPEFIGMCDRAYIMYKGQIVDEIEKEQLTQENVVMLAAGGKINE